MSNRDRFAGHYDSPDDFEKSFAGIPEYLKRPRLPAEDVEDEDDDFDEDDFDEDDFDDEDGLSNHFSFLDQIEAEEDPSPLLKTPEDFESHAADLSAAGRHAQAIKICAEGLELFPHDANLHAFRINAAHELGQHREAAHLIAHMKALVPEKRWTWRCYAAQIQHLMLDPFDNERAIRRLLEPYKALGNEMAYLAEYQLELKLGNETAALTILRFAVGKQPNAIFCACELAEMLLKNASYEEALETCEYGILASFCVDGMIDRSAFYVMRFLARAALLHQRFYDGEPETASYVMQINSMIRAGNEILRAFKPDKVKADAVENVISQLEVLKPEVWERRTTDPEISDD